jgi:hypothetical protein
LDRGDKEQSRLNDLSAVENTAAIHHLIYRDNVSANAMADNDS